MGRLRYAHARGNRYTVGFLDDTHGASGRVAKDKAAAAVTRLASKAPVTGTAVTVGMTTHSRESQNAGGSNAFGTQECERLRMV